SSPTRQDGQPDLAQLRSEREPDGPRARALIDGHGSVAEREAQPRRSRIDEGERIGRGHRAPVVELEDRRIDVLVALVALADLVLAAAVGLASLRLVALAHGGSSFRSCWWWRSVSGRWRSGGEALGGPETGAPGTWVGGDLGGARRERRSRDQGQPRGAATHAYRELGRAGATPPFRGDEALHDPVLERVGAQHHEPSTRPPQVHGGG